LFIFGGFDVISVVVPALNEEGYITSCLESLTSQSYDDYELIVVDGGSSDRAVELAEKYADQVIVFRGPVGAARNIGVNRSRGEILAFVDADTVALKSLRARSAQARRGWEEAGEYDLTTFSR